MTIFISPRAEEFARKVEVLGVGWHVDRIYRPELKEVCILAVRDGGDDYMEVLYRRDTWIEPAYLRRNGFLSRPRWPNEVLSKASTAGRTLVQLGNALMVRNVPFDPENTNVHEVLDAVRDKTVVFLNSISEKLEEVTVSGHYVKRFELVSGNNGRPIMTFASARGPHASGIRSIALENIVDVR